MSQGRLTLARIVTFIGIPALIAIERGAYYAIRGVFRRYLMDEPGGGLGLSRLESAQIPATWTLSMLPLLLVGGLIVFAAGPRIPLVAGFALMAAGAMILGHGGQAALWPALLLIAAGQGLVKPASYSVIAHEIGRGMDKVLLADHGDRYVVYARRLFRDRARFAMAIHDDGRILVPEGKKLRELVVRSRFGVTVWGDYIRFADKNGTDLGRVSIPWIAPEDRRELARRIGQLVDREQTDFIAWPPDADVDRAPRR